MSLTGALSNAVSGLRATSVSADIVGSNIANALNENYARREVALAQDSMGESGGVRVASILRHSNSVANSDWRASNGRASGLEAQSDALVRLNTAFGDATEAGSLQSLVTDLEAQLVSASTRPDVDQRLSITAYALGDVAYKINDISSAIQEERQIADNAIGEAVGRVNELLEDLQNNNVQLFSAPETSSSYSQLLDQRDTLLNELSEYMEVKTYPREFNTVAIYSASGEALVEAGEVQFDFTTTAVISPQHSVSTGVLGQVEVDGSPVDISRLSGGKLEALFELRDEIAVEAQDELDAFAYELATRLNDTSFDPSRTATDPGILTDNGSIVDPANVAGFSARISLNQTIDPREGGDARRLRDGVLGTVPGNVGDASMLNGIIDALSAPSTITFGEGAGTNSSISGFASDIASSFGSDRIRLENQLTAAESEKASFNELRLANGVDTDTELQNLLLIEQAYGANARVIQIIDSLMQTLLETV